jgi:hypothetical protein
LSVVVVILPFASAGVAGGAKPIAVHSVGCVPGGRLTGKHSGAIVKPKKANAPIGWPRIVGDMAKNHLIKKTWMIKLQHRRYPSVKSVRKSVNWPVPGTMFVIFAGSSALL